MRTVAAVALALLACGCGQTAASGPGSAAPPSAAPAVSVVDGNGDPVTLPLGPLLDPGHLPALPAHGVAVELGTDPNVTVLVSLTGGVIGHVVRDRMGNRRVVHGGTLAAIKVDDGPSLGCFPVRGGGGRYQQCRSRTSSWLRDVRSGRVLARAWPTGSYRGAWLSPDGRTLLAQWSGECEEPVAVLVSTDGGGQVAADGRHRSPRHAAESDALGWTPAGRAAVLFPQGACGPGLHRPGVYLVSPRGAAPRLLFATRKLLAWGGYTW